MYCFLLKNIFEYFKKLSKEGLTRFEVDFVVLKRLGPPNIDNSLIVFFFETNIDACQSVKKRSNSVPTISSVQADMIAGSSFSFH